MAGALIPCGARLHVMAVELLPPEAEGLSFACLQVITNY